MRGLLVVRSAFLDVVSNHGQEGDAIHGWGRPEGLVGIEGLGCCSLDKCFQTKGAMSGGGVAALR